MIVELGCDARKPVFEVFDHLYEASLDSTFCSECKAKALITGAHSRAGWSVHLFFCMQQSQDFSRRDPNNGHLLKELTRLVII